MTTATSTQQTQRSFLLAGEEQITVTPAAQDAAFQSLARGTRDGALKLRGIPTLFGSSGATTVDEGTHGCCFPLFRQAWIWRGYPILKDHFWMNPFAKHFSTIKASDLVLVDDEGYVTEGGAQIPINEAGFMIHSEIHKARPDVIAAAHTHGIYGKTWSSFGKNIEMLTQDACNLFGRVSVYEDHGGIALSQDEGKQIAAALGKDNIACILQNHGLLTVGTTVDEAAILYSFLENACQSQLLAEAAAANGIPKRIINDEVAQYTANVAQNPHNLYTEFQPEFDLIVEESNGRVLQ
ncbi:Meiotically protein [Penicillium cosmopolitanum]|uniref:Meiotically protein n=1 Tax=Penicillium cosmopolitanum TaxID=1131564 RepID=A0A9X0B2W6_9EURO|nr:Meiotically protein [Penicillium cosmopolitanum]KAJ5386106.1 Meiotically protein [Penicillium cosmopolitanum]